METLPPPAIDLSPQLYCHLVYTLTGLLPPPIDDSPAALQARNHTAIAKVAALLPVGANEIDLAAHCIAARAQAEEMLRMVRVYADDIELVMRLNAQYSSTLRTSLSVHGRLMRVQAVRQKREAIEGAATEDAWTAHVAERSMSSVLAPKANPSQAAPPEEAPVRMPAPCENQSNEENISKTGTYSHNVAFETRMSEQSGYLGSSGSGETGELEAMPRSILAISRARARELPANGL